MRLMRRFRAVVLVALAGVLLTSCQDAYVLDFTNHCARTVEVLPYIEFPDNAGWGEPGHEPWLVIAPGETGGGFMLSVFEESFDLVVRDPDTHAVVSTTHIRFQEDLMWDNPDEYAGGDWTVDLAGDTVCLPVLPQAPESSETDPGEWVRYGVRMAGTLGAMVVVAYWLIRWTDRRRDQRRNHA